MWYINTTDYYLPLKNDLRNLQKKDGTRKKLPLCGVNKTQNTNMAHIYL